MHILYYLIVASQAVLVAPFRLAFSRKSSVNLQPLRMSQQEIYPSIQINEKTSEQNLKEYQDRYSVSIKDPSRFWNEESSKYLSWFVAPKSTMDGTFIEGDINWFAGGKLNAAYNCIDKHLESKGDQIAIIWESDEPGEGRSVSFRELGREVSRIANLMLLQGVKKGDVVTLYMPMIPELAMVII